VAAPDRAISFPGNQHAANGWHRLQETHTRVIEISTEQVERRIAHALLRLANQAGRKVEGGVKIDFPISRQDIAEMTGTTLHTVSRTLSLWEQQGLVGSARQSVVLKDPHRLFVLAEQTPEGREPVRADDSVLLRR
jgi:hypothetical protein